MIVLMIMILIFMVVFGMCVKNQKEGVVQSSASKSSWQATAAGTYTTEDKITIKLKGADPGGIQGSSLSENNITVYLNENIVDCTKTVTKKETSENYVLYDIELSGFTTGGMMQLKIGSGTLTDKSGKTNSDVYIGTGIIIQEPPVDYATLESMYGTVVSGYTGYSETDVTEWKLLYVDEEKEDAILISSNRLPTSGIPINSYTLSNFQNDNMQEIIIGCGWQNVVLQQ